MASKKAKNHSDVGNYSLNMTAQVCWTGRGANSDGSLVSRARGKVGWIGGEP